MGLGHRIGQADWVEKLRRTLDRHRGARLGEASVVSRQIHTVDPRAPHRISVLTGLDAGRVFYHRAKPGDVIHVDIFHAVGEVDHRAVAAALRRALVGVHLADSAPPTKTGMVADYLDIQTGTGGGRVTGDLTYGTKESLKASHRNHVHVAGLLPDEQIHLLTLMVDAVESEIARQGFEIRRIESLCHMPAGGQGAPLDLSHYSDRTDTWLRGEGANERSAGGGGSGASQGQAGGQSLRGTGWHEGPQPGQGGIAESRDPPELPASGDAPAPSWDALEVERRLQAALELSQRLGSPDEVKRVLDELERSPSGWASLCNYGSSQTPFLIRQLEEEGLVRRDIRGLRLTGEGRDLAHFLDRHLRDVKLRFRKLVRRLPRSAGTAARVKTAPPSADVRYGRVAGTAPAEPGAWLGDIAVPETLFAAIRRTHMRRLDGSPSHFSLRREDIHVNLRSGDQPLHICLLIDASASMAGRRILAAKHLARHLLVSTRDRVSVIAFQERDVKVYVPFTRDWSQVEVGLSRIQPLGLTPLAQGLSQSMELIRESRVRRSLLLLITDGIPTVPKWTIDPLADALEAARQVGRERIPFGCIGLQPSRRYLEELSKAAGGTLHVVEELNEDSLVHIAHRERSKASEKGRGTPLPRR